MVKLPTILATALVIGTAALTSPATAVSPKSLIEEPDILVQEAAGGELVAGRIPWELQRHPGKSLYPSGFDLYYVKNCRYRLTLEQCYYLYNRDGGRSRRRGVLRGQRVNDRYDKDLWRRHEDANRSDDPWQLRNRRRVRRLGREERLENRRDALKKEIKLRNRQLNRRDQRIDELKDRVQDLSERDRNSERKQRRSRRRRDRDD